MGWTLVTGGAKRLGREICLSLAKQGYDIALHYDKSEKEAQKTVLQCRKYGVRAEKIQGNFSTKASTLDFTKRYLSQFPNTKNVVHNVGNYKEKKPIQMAIEDYENLFQLNFFAPVLITKKIVSSIKKQKGNIITIGVFGINSRKVKLTSAVYFSAKMALFSWTQSIAKQLAPNVCVNMVSPGYLDFSVNLPNKKKIPMQRYGKAKDIASCIGFLLSEKGRYITGQNIEICGGL